MANKRILSFDNTSEILKRIKSGVEDDQNGHLICYPGKMISDKYKILNILGEGKYSKVVLAHNVRTDTKLALKILKNAEMTTRDLHTYEGRREIMILKDIAKLDTEGTSLCIKMIDSFEYHGHICIAFEALGVSILKFLENNNFHPFPLEHVRHIAYQLCYAVNFLHENGITHTDLKPDNVVFLDSSYSEYFSSIINKNMRLIKRTDIRLIDFGKATYDEDFYNFNISNRLYRAPEVILKLCWSQPVDVWSLACIFYELYSGHILFDTQDDDVQHLAEIEKVLGRIPSSMLKSAVTKDFFKGKLNRLADRNDVEPIFKRRRHSKNEEDTQFFDLLKQMLQYEPSQRITLGEALRHPFFSRLPTYQLME